MKKILLFLFLVFLFSYAFAVITHGEMKIYAVTTQGEGLSADLIIDLEPGTGRVWTDVQPLVGTTTQGAALTAVNLAKNYSPEVDNYDYKFDIDSDASIVEGPSAGAAMALLTISMLRDKQFQKNVSITGTISEDGYVGGVGGVYEKTKEAAETGIDLFMIPRGEAKQTVRINGEIRSINLLEYAPENFGVKVVEVSTIDDALQYAFSDIEQIDINIGQDYAIPDFIPIPVQHRQSLIPMKKLTTEYIQETKILVGQARNSLSTTLIDDASAVAALLELLNAAEKQIKEAEILNEKNYLYSAANYSFLAKVNAMLVKDISENPAMLEPNSTVFDLKLNSLKKDVEKLEDDLNDYVPVDKIEWYIAAQQRLSWAKLNVDKLLSARVIVISNGSVVEEPAEIFANIQDYEFAAAWYKAATDFWVIAEESTMIIRPNDAFKNSMDEFIVQTENALTVLDESEVEDIERRLNAAREERDKGWYLSSLFDAASAYALVASDKIVEGKDLDQLYQLLKEKIDSLDSNIATGSHSFVWATLYLDHAKYFLASADYYYEKEQGSAAISALKSGISLALLAEQLYMVSEDIYNYTDSIDPGEYLPGRPLTANGDTERPFPIDWLAYSITLVLLIFILIALMLILLASLLHLKVYRRHYCLLSEINHIKKLQRKVDEGFAAGKISEQKHSELTEKYAADLKELQRMREIKSDHLLEVDRLRAELIGFEHRLRDLRNHYKEGFLSEQEYKEKTGSYRKKIDELKKLIKSEGLEIRLEKAELIKFVEEKTTVGKGKPKSNLPVLVRKESLVAVKTKAAVKKPKAKKIKAMLEKGKKKEKPVEKKKAEEKKKTAKKKQKSEKNKKRQEKSKGPKVKPPAKKAAN